MRHGLAAPLIVSLVLPSLAVEGNLLRNPGFDEDLSSWTTGHTWYTGEGNGLSEITWADGALKVTGTGNRAIAIQALPAFPDTYRVSGRIRCEGLEGAEAIVNVEWKTGDSTYLGGERIGGVTGTTDWTDVTRTVTAPVDAETVFVEVMTTAPNSGPAWFDDISFEDTTTDDIPPGPVAFEVTSPDGASGTIRLDFAAATVDADAARFEAFVEPEPFATTGGLRPRGVGGRKAREIRVEGLENGRTYNTAVVAVDQDGNRITDVVTQEATPMDRQAPRAVRLQAEPVIGSAPGAYLSWLPHPLDEGEVERYGVVWRRAGEAGIQAPRELAGDVSSYHLRDLPAGVALEMGVIAEDAAGNASEPAWVPVTTVAADGAILRTVDDAGRAVAGRFTATPVEAPGASTDLLGGVRPGVYRVIASADGYCFSAPVLMALGGEPVGHTFTLRPSGAGGVRLWAADALDKVFRDAPAPAEPGAISLLSGRNESESAQIVIRADEALAGVRVWATHLVREGGDAVIPSERISAHFVGYVRVEANSKATPPEELVRLAPADFPDELLDATSIDIPAGQCQPVLLRLATPANATPGIYSGAVHVEVGWGDFELPVRLEVLPIDFPEKTRLLVTNWFGTGEIARHHGVEEWSDEHWAWLRVYARAMADHHQNVVLTSIGLVDVIAEDDGTYSYDFTRFDRWVELFDSEGMAARIELSHLGSRKTGEWECPEFVFSPRPATRRSDGSATEVPVPEFVHALQEHLRERGWLERAMLHIADEPIPVNEGSWRQLSRVVAEAAPDLRRIDAIHVTDLDGDLEVWVPQLNFFDEAHSGLMAKQAAGTAEVWFYIAWVPQGKYPNRLVDMATIKTRLPHWMNYLYGAPGYLHWGLNWWTIEFGHFSPGDEWIVWPGEYGPRSSLRYEAQREGIEDYEYLAMLEDLRRAAGDPDPGARSRELSGRIIRSITDYDKDPAALQSVRETLLREIAAQTAH